MMDSAMASSAKASFELDSYLGSAGSDARSAVRRGMSAQVTNNILSTTQQNIAALYSGHVSQVVETTLAGSEINSKIKLAAAETLGSLANTAGNLILGTNSAILSSYAQNMDYAVALMNNQTQRMEITSREKIAFEGFDVNREELDLKETLGKLSSRTELQQSGLWWAKAPENQKANRAKALTDRFSFTDMFAV